MHLNTLKKIKRVRGIQLHTRRSITPLSGAVLTQKLYEREMFSPSILLHPTTSLRPRCFMLACTRQDGAFQVFFFSCGLFRIADSDFPFSSLCAFNSIQFSSIQFRSTELSQQQSVRQSFSQIDGVGMHA